MEETTHNTNTNLIRWKNTKIFHWQRRWSVVTKLINPQHNVSKNKFEKRQGNQMNLNRLNIVSLSIWVNLYMLMNTSKPKGNSCIVWVCSYSSRRWWPLELHRCCTFLGEKTPRVPPSSRIATPISANRASLRRQKDTC